MQNSNKLFWSIDEELDKLKWYNMYKLTSAQKSLDFVKPRENDRSSVETDTKPYIQI